MSYLQKHATDCEIRGFCPTTTSTYQGHIRHYLQHVHDPRDVSHDELRQVMQDLRTKDYKSSTYTSYWSAINDFYKFLQYEGQIDHNPITGFRERYLPRILQFNDSQERQYISLDDMKRLIHRSHNIQEFALMMFLAKTGLRRGELLDMEWKDVDFNIGTVKLKPKRKRSRLKIFMDEELIHTMGKYCRWWDDYSTTTYIWTNKHGNNRMNKDMPNQIIQHHGAKLGLHNADPDAPLEQRLSCHCFRHFFTTQLFNAGMRDEYIKWLRGDSLNREAWQIYLHIDMGDVRREYVRCIPSLL